MNASRICPSCQYNLTESPKGTHQYVCAGCGRLFEANFETEIGACDRCEIDINSSCPVCFGTGETLVSAVHYQKIDIG